MSHAHDCSASNTTKTPFKNLQGVLNDQLYAVTDLSTGICLSLRRLLYAKAMLWYSIVIHLARSGWEMISYSKDMFVILYLVSGCVGDPVDTMT